MKSLWPENFEENPQRTPKSIFEEQAKLLPKITGDIVYAEVVPEDLSANYGEFCYRFVLIGKFINYTFKVLTFTHDIALYPVKFNITEFDMELSDELELRVGPIEKRSPEELEEFLGEILKSKRIRQVIGSIIKLSK